MTRATWAYSLKSHIWVFNVGRGISIFIRTALNQGIIYDFGCSDEFKPTDFLKKHLVPHLSKYSQFNIAQAIISHPHSDHMNEISCLNESTFHPALLTCPHHMISGTAKPEALNWNRINNPKGTESNVELYKSLYKDRTLPLQTISYDSPLSIPNLEYGLYYVRPPIVDRIFPDNDQEYGNGLSLVFFYRHGYHTLLIPGDINPDTFKHLLDGGVGLEKRYTIFDRRQSTLHPTWHKISDNQPSLKSLLRAHGLSILIAPHHGLKSGYSEDLYKTIKDEMPGLVVISEKRHVSENDGEVEPFYQSSKGALGQKVIIDNEEKFVNSISTRNGHHILIVFQGTGGKPEVYLDKDPEALLRQIN